MKPQRLQVDIKPGHQSIVKDLMKRLGNVSSADAIGFLIETQMSAALARLEPSLSVPHFVAERTQGVTHSPKPQHEIPQTRQKTTLNHTAPQDDAAKALDALLSA